MKEPHAEREIVDQSIKVVWNEYKKSDAILKDKFRF